MDRALGEIRKLDAFLEHLLHTVDLQEHLLILTSDHGNIEDLSVKTHTKNPVFTLLWGRQAGRIAGRIKTLEDIAPALMGLLTG